MTRLGFISSVAFFAITISAGYFAGGSSWKGVIYLSDGSILGKSRNPAAIKRELDFSKLDGVELITASQKRLVTAARVIPKPDMVGVELGHFVTRDAEGQRRLACDAFFNRLTLRFEAEGIASAGEKTLMEIDAPCRTSSNDISSIEPVWIPVAKIFAERPKSQSLDFQDGVTYKFENLSGVWPVRWSLQSVRLYNSQDSARVVNITSRDMRAIRPKPFVLNWLEAKK